MIIFIIIVLIIIIMIIFFTQGCQKYFHLQDCNTN